MFRTRYGSFVLFLSVAVVSLTVGAIAGGSLLAAVRGDGPDQKAVDAYEQLRDLNLAPEERHRLIEFMAGELSGPRSGIATVSLLGELQRDAHALDAFAPRFPTLLREALAKEDEPVLCNLATLVAHVEAVPAAVEETLLSVYQRSEKFPRAADLAAAALLTRNGDRPEVVAWFRDRLRNREGVLRSSAARALAYARKGAEPLVADLRPLLADPSVEVRVHAARTLTELKHADAAVVGALEAALTEPVVAKVERPVPADSLVPAHVHSALWVLERIGPPAAEAVDTITELIMKTDDGYARQCACQALGEIGVDSSAVRRTLKWATEYGEPNVKGHARLALAKLDKNHVEKKAD